MTRQDPGSLPVALTVACATSLAIALAAAPAAPAGQAKDPTGELPPHIIKLSNFGERADWSHDGRRLLFVEKTFGDVYEIEVATRELRLLTGRYPHAGYTRALYLA